MHNLTPEQKEIGKRNFHAAVGSSPTRRDFLKAGIAAGAIGGVGMGAMYYGYDKIADPVRVGVIGTGDEGNVLIGAMNPDYVQVVAVADIRPYNRHRVFHGDWSSDNAHRVRPGLMEKFGWKTQAEAEKHVRVYKDRYEELLEDKDVEAVIIALPLHLHDEAAIQAMRAGKHVLTEKLMAHSVAQCKNMGRVAAAERKILATGHQRHYSILYDNAVDTIQRGLIGNIHHIRAQWHRGNLPGKDSWSQPMPPPEDWSREKFSSKEAKDTYPLLSKWQSWTRKLESVKRGGNMREIELWTDRVNLLEAQIEDRMVEAANYGYQEKKLPNGYVRSPLEELIRWRLWNRTGGGLMAELGSHQLDAASIFISAQHEDRDKVHPLSVSAVGGRHIFPMDRECDDHVYCIFEFPNAGYFKDGSDEIDDPNKKIVVTYSSINGNGFGGYGETVMGTEGTLILEKEQDVLLYKGSSTSTKVGVKDGSSGPTLDTTESGDAAAAVAQAAMDGPVSRGYREEIEHWAWCIRNPDPKNQPKCHPKVALADAVIALTSNIAMDKKTQIQFDPAWFDINSDATPDGKAPTEPPAKGVA